MKAPKAYALLMAAAAALILGGCATPTKVDYDSAALDRILTYKCFTIDSREQRADYQDIMLSPIVDRRIERELTDALLASGYTMDCASPDFRVTFNTITQTKTEITDLSVGPRPFRRYPYYGYARYPLIDIDEYEEGTFVIDIIDYETEQLVWRGAYIKRLGWSAPSDEDIKTIVAEILENFPPGLRSTPD